MRGTLVFVLVLTAANSHAVAESPDDALAQTLAAAHWKSALRLELQRPVDARLMKIESAGIERGLFTGAVHVARQAADVRALSGKLQPGDQLVLAGAEWRDASFTLEARGTPEAPILVRPETPGGVVFTGESTVRFHGAHLIVHDLAFRGVTVSQNNTVIFAIGNGEAKPADSCIFNRIRFEDCGSTKADYWPRLHMWLMSMRGSDNTVANCTFSGLRNIGQMLSAAHLPKSGLQRLHILNNRFSNRPYLDRQNGYEIIQIGWSAEKAGPTGSLIQGNTFENCDGENELITLKASDIVLRDNQILGCQGVFCLRTANRVLAQGNLFDGKGRSNTGGIRLQGMDHVVIGNTFRNLKQPQDYYFWPVSFMASDQENFGDDDSVSGYGRAKNILIARNRFEHCDHRLAAGIYPRPEYPLLPRNIHVLDNVFVGTKAESVFDYVAPDPRGELIKELHEAGNEFQP